MNLKKKRTVKKFIFKISISLKVAVNRTCQRTGKLFMVELLPN